MPSALARGQVATVPNRRKAFQSTIPANLYSGLIHAWMLNEGSGSTVPDRIGGKDLTLQSPAAWSTQSGMTCVDLGGSGWLDTAAFLVGTNDVTMAGWFYTTTDPGSYNGMFFSKDPVNAQWEIFNFGGQYLLRGASTTSAQGTSAPGSFAWGQVAGTITGSTGKLYTNGVDVTISSTVTAFTDSSSALQIGRYNSGYYFGQKVGPCYIYNRALSASEIAQLYTAIYLY